MIKKIEFKDSEKLVFKPTNLNIFVGPNNSGKSMTLREIYYDLTREINQDCNMVQSLSQDMVFSEEEIDKFIDKYSIPDPYNFGNILFLLNDGKTHSANMDYAKQILRKDIYDGDSYLVEEKMKIVNSKRCRMITGSNRLSSFDYKNYEPYPSKAEIHEIQNSDHIMNTLIGDRSKYLQVRKHIYDAFHKYLAIKLNKASACLVLTDSMMPEELELSIKPETLAFLENASDSRTVSDGIKAYTLIISELIAGEASEIFIDEPEAFLHPPLAKKLGGIIGQLAKEQNKQVFISTHSSNFLMGCIEVNAPTNLIRFTYESNVGRAKLINSEELQTMMKKPILRSTNVIDAIFYRKVIVTEADSDRAFYQEINYRKLSDKENTGIEDCLFLNAQNKQTVGDIVRPLRKIGIPTVSILDLDMIKEKGGDFTKYLTSVNIPTSSIKAIQAYKTDIFNAFSNAEVNRPDKTPEIMKNVGIDFFKINDLEIYETSEAFINQLNKYGLFIVYTGQVESWLKQLGIEGHGNYWLTNIFNRMGDNPQSEYYVKPNLDDVWKFMDTIKYWLENPLRKGMQ